jgi:nucleoside-diphosphate-sugar epimerase
MEKILITGANGQIGTVLTKRLIDIFGEDSVIATDLNTPNETGIHFEQLDILDPTKFQSLVDKYKITQIYHLASLLSAKGEQNPSLTWNVNFNGLITVLEICKTNKIKKLFFPSSIAVFGSTTPKAETPQDVPLLPDTVYGIGKVAGELWCNYYASKYGLDVRSLRYPGIIGYQSLPGGGTTDYAVDIFHHAIKTGNYTCFLEENTILPMMYMDDAMNATIHIMEAPEKNIRIRSSYNVGAFSFSPKGIYDEICKHIPEFKIEYIPDFRQQIAESWVQSINDSEARNDWGWKPQFSFEMMVEDMILNLKKYYNL